MHTVTFSASLTEIGESAFYGCRALTDARFFEGLNVIKKNAFDGCTALGTVDLPRSLNSVEDYAFNGCTALSKVIYDGTLAEYAVISVGEYNDYLDYAAIESLS